MNMKLATFIVACIFGIELFSAPIRADKAARNTVKQCFMNMQSVRSYRDQWFLKDGGSKDILVTSSSETMDAPRIVHNVFTMGSDKSETIATKNILYTHESLGRWKAETAQRSLVASWSQVWLKRYNPAATYHFVRHGVLNSAPMNVYASTLIRRTGQRNTMIWIGAKDQLPYMISTRDLDAHGVVQTTSVEILSDFNAPIKIDVPDAVPSDSPTPQTTPDGSHPQ